MQTVSQDIERLFRFCDQIKPKRKTQPYRIKINGRFVKMGRNNKSMWNSLGAAKSALSCHYKRYITRIILTHEGVQPIGKGNYVYFSSADVDNAWREFLEWSIDTGFLEFVPVEE